MDTDPNLTVLIYNRTHPTRTSTAILAKKTQEISTVTEKIPKVTMMNTIMEAIISKMERTRIVMLWAVEVMKVGRAFPGDTQCSQVANFVTS